MNNFEKKRNNLLIFLVVLFIIIILCLVGYICYDKGVFLNDNNNNNDDMVKELDLSKCLNNSKVSYSNQSDALGNYGLSLEINQDKKSLTLTTDNDVFMPIVNQITIGSTWIPNSKSVYKIKGFEKNVVDFFIGELGQDATGLTLFFLMEDKTVEYIPLFLNQKNNDGTTYYDLNFKYEYDADSKISDTYFSSMGTVTGVKDIIKLYNVDVSSGYRTTIGAKKDGSFYDLGKIITE